MIHFFRRIRKSLLEDSKFRKYLVYAIGEIALVMIGILLALQVNNWNENRKKIDLESTLLLAIRDDIEDNLEVLNKKMVTNLMYLQSSEIVLKALDQCQPYRDSMDAHFSKMARIEYFSFSKASFETLKSEGVSVIRNQHLRRTVINLFENSYHLIDERDALGSGNDLLAEYIIPRFRWGFGLGVPLNYPSLCEDDEFKNMIFFMINSRNNIDAISKTIVGNSQYVLELIDGYIDNIP